MEPIINIAIVGETNSGKSCLWKTHLHQKFHEEYVSTVFDYHSTIYDLTGGAQVRI